MNYFAHGFRFLHDPYFFAGTALPDWLGVVDRKLRLPPNQVRRWLDDPDPTLRSLAAGVLQHHEDDEAFHTGAAFSRLQVEFARAIKGQDPNARDLAKYLLAHIVPELMLDSLLIECQPARLDDYYDVVLSLDGNELSGMIARMAGREPDSLVKFLGIFHRERFLADYGDDAKLCYRLSQVLNRVGWGPLPERFEELVPSMRQAVDEVKGELIAFLGEGSPFGKV